VMEHVCGRTPTHASDFCPAGQPGDLRSLCPLVVALAWGGGGEDSRLAVRVHHALSLEEAVETADFQLKVTELLVHYGALCLRLYMRHL
jgi:hypothetical protein